jgi:hypothetical protein
MRNDILEPFYQYVNLQTVVIINILGSVLELYGMSPKLTRHLLFFVNCSLRNFSRRCYQDWELPPHIRLENLAINEKADAIGEVHKPFKKTAVHYQKLRKQKIGVPTPGPFQGTNTV